MTWRHRALCRFLPAELWDTDGRPPVEALRVCLACPVLADCGQAALEEVRVTQWDAGVRAASSAYDRRLLRSGATTWPQVWSRSARRVEHHDRIVSTQLGRWFLDQAAELAARRSAA